MLPSAKFRKEQWKMLLLTMSCYLFFYTGRHNFGWAAKAMAGDLHISYALIGSISSAMLIGYAIGQLVNGNLADYLSPRAMILTGATLSVAANFLISLLDAYTPILICWAFNGYFQSMAWAPGSRIIANWWRREDRGKAFGCFTLAAGSSSALTYLISILLVQRGWSWHAFFRVPLFCLLPVAIIFYFFVRNKPSDKGYANPYEDTGAAGDTDWKERYGKVFRNRRFLIAAISLGFENMARYGLLLWVPVHYLGSNWKDDPRYLWASILMPIGMGIGAFSFGAFSEKIFRGNRPVSISFGMLMSGCLALLIYWVPVSNLAASAVLMFAVGFFVYGPQANFWPMSPEMLGEKYVGTGVGFLNMSAYLFAAAGEPFLGWVIDKTHQTSSVFIVLSLLCLLSALTILFAREKKSLLPAITPLTDMHKLSPETRPT